MRTGQVSLVVLWLGLSLIGCSKTPTPKVEMKSQATSVDQKKMDEDFAAQAEAARLKFEADMKRQEDDARAKVEAERQAEYKKRVIERLKDPASAQFRNLRMVNGGTVLCGEVNAKNSFGGYVGFTAFVVDDQLGVVIASPELNGTPMPIETHYGCR